MAEFPALPLWTDAFLADTVHLNVAETGAYLLLLMASWRTEDGGLPNDDKALARYAKCRGREWATIKTSILPFWTLCSDTRLRQKRLERERVFVRDKTTKAKASAEARWLKFKETRDANAAAEQLRKDQSASPPTPTPTPTPTPIERKKEEEAATASPAKPEPAKTPTGADAPRPADDAGPIPGFLDRRQPPDIKTAIFGVGLRWLMEATAAEESSCRSFLGKLIGEHGEQETATALMGAAKAQPIDPRAWLKRNIGRINGNGPRNGGRHGEPGSNEIIDGINAALSRRSVSPG